MHTPHGARARALTRLVVPLIGYMLLAALAIVGAACLVGNAAHAHDGYTGLRRADGALCCGLDDCEPYPAENVTEVQGGYRLHDGVFVPRANVIPSFDGRYHRCDWNGNRAHCFLVPLSS